MGRVGGRDESEYCIIIRALIFILLKESLVLIVLVVLTFPLLPRFRLQVLGFGLAHAGDWELLVDVEVGLLVDGLEGVEVVEFVGVFGEDEGGQRFEGGERLRGLSGLGLLFYFLL